ncbi:MAG: zinc permease [Actinobacteria bacterium]|nr:zinc permease [Actinomycetota bacterium]
MLTALLVGLAVSSALVIGAVTGAFWRPPQGLVAIALAFASGALITALAFDLFEEAFEAGGPWIAGGGLLVGAAAFVIADELLDRYGGSSGFALRAENLALGVGLIGSSLSGILALLVGIFASNLPEALGGAVDMRNGGRSRAFVVAIWTATAVLLTIAVVMGNVLFTGVSENVLAFARAFAAGAVLASLADTVMPDAYRQGGPLVAFATAAGFLLTFLISQ